jgi:hypothetical protein
VIEIVGGGPRGGVEGVVPVVGVEGGVPETWCRLEREGTSETTAAGGRESWGGRLAGSEAALFWKWPEDPPYKVGTAGEVVVFIPKGVITFVLGGCGREEKVSPRLSSYSVLSDPLGSLSSLSLDPSKPSDRSSSKNEWPSSLSPGAGAAAVELFLRLLPSPSRFRRLAGPKTASSRDIRSSREIFGVFGLNSISFPLTFPNVSCCRFAWSVVLISKRNAKVQILKKS